MRSWLWLSLVVASSTLFAAPAVAGDLGLGGDAPSRIPVPARDYTASVEDAAGVEQTLTRVTFNGEVFFYGTLGDAQVTIPFERVTQIEVQPSQTSGQVVLFATLTDATTARILAESDLPLYGSAPFGNYKVEIGKVRFVRLSATAPD